MQKKVFSLMMGLILAFTGLVRADELTVYDGTTSVGQLPLYGYWADNYTRSQYVIPAADLSAMAGAQITGLQYYQYGTSASSADWGCDYYVYLTEVSNTTMSSLVARSSATTVFTGHLAAVNGGMTVTFDTPYNYQGGNLLIGMDNLASGTYISYSWAATYVEYAAGYYQYGSSGNTSSSPYIPKTTFTYSAGGGTTCPLVVTPDPIDFGYRPNNCWMRPMVVNVTNEGAATNIFGVDVDNAYFVPALGEDYEIPFALGRNESFDINFGWTSAPEGQVNGQLVVDYQGNRTAALFDLTAYAYEPVEPDVWEMARVINAAYPFQYRNTATEGVTLYDNYLLPGNAQDGPDAVYKVTFNQDVMLSGTVTKPGTEEMAENGKMAVYTQAGIDAVGGPDLTNFYVGPTIGGGQGSESYDVVFGDETTSNTTGYYPCYHLYNYSLSESLYHAADLQTAGMGAGVINSIGYNTSDTYGFTMNGVKIWMANVSDAEVGTTSHITAGMTCVYEGSFTQVQGWNEFALNGNFEWDGTSNLLVVFQMNNGSWGSTINWKSMETSYVAGFVDFNDYTPYSPETNTYDYYYTHFMLPVTHFVGGGREAANRADEYIIENMTMVPGTYYIAASSTERAWDVVLNAEALPCPEPATVAAPADDADGLEPEAVTLSWQLGRYTTEYRLVFGSTYYCEDVLVDWTTDLAQSYTVRNLYNNTNYFWRVDERNGNCETYGEVWGFTTHLNIPQNLRVADETIFEGQSAVLSWNAIQDRTYRYYNIYQDNELIGSTPANQVVTTYTVDGLTYNMDGYSFYVTAVYDEGESAPSNAVEVKVSGNGSVAGHVYEQDGETGIANATVTFTGTDEFGDAQTFNFITDATGAYGGAIMAGEYDGQAACEGYQTITQPTCGNPVNFTYAQTTTPVDFVMDENFTPVCQVIAQYYPDSLDPASPYVKVYWGCGLPGSAIIEDFETGDFSQFDYNFPGSYPWEIVTTHPYEGQYCMKSGGTNVASASSSVEVTVDIPRDGLFSFYSYISCESSWDNGYYYMDGAQMGTVTGLGNNWVKKEFAVTEGTHTFKWTYTKDSSVNSGEDAWFVDYIDFIHDAEPAQPGWHTYAEGELDNALGSTLTTTPSWGYLYTNGGGFGGMRLTKVALFSDNAYGAVGGNYTLNVILGGATPDEGSVASTMTVDVPSNQGAWVEWDLATPVNVTNNQNLWVIWTANSTVSDWPAGMAPGSDANGSWWNGGNGWEQMLSSYGDVWTMKNYFAGRGGREMAHSFSSNKNANHAVAPTPQFTTVKPVKGEEVVSYNICNPNAIHSVVAPSTSNRAFSHYRVYRTNCYQESPYTEQNTVVLACELQDTLYIDVSWPDAAPGVYKWGVGVVYAGNRESEITWSEPVVVPGQGQAAEATRDIIEIGNGTSTTYVTPFNSLWGYSVVEQIYTAAEIGTAGTINSISFNMDPAYTAQTNSVEVFMKNVTRSDFTGGYEPLAATDMVYSGTVTFNPGWTTITLDTPFQYDGTSNLMIALHEYTPGYSTRYFYYTDAANAAISFHSDGANPDPYNLGSFSGSNYLSNNRANIQLDITAGGGNHEPIQEPRESEIVWSNCLDKDMYLNGVSVNVLLNSADSPEGVNVALTNLNEAEQEMYPVDPVILDGTGFYAWESFRRGDYAVSVTFDGYYPIYDTVRIWSDTELRYVMTEILAPISSEIYVSRTGWAMWDEVGPGPVPPHGDGDEWAYSFDNNNDGWTTINADGDDHNWYHSSEAGNHSTMAITSHTGAGHMMSESYCNSTWAALFPDEYLVAPAQSAIAAGSTFSFWCCAQDASYAAEHFGVAISTTGNTNAADFTTIQEWTLTAKGGHEANPAATRNGEGTREGNWYQYTTDLSAYAGQNVWIAIRHFNCSDQFILCLDDAELAVAAKSGDRHFQYYKVMCTSIDGVPIYNHNTVIPMCQLDTNDPYQAPLVEGGHYLCKVAVMYSTGMSAWSEPVEWVYEPCDHWGPVDFVEFVDDNEGNHIHWEFEHGFNPYDPVGPVPPTPGEGEYIQYCTETFSGGVGTGGGEVWWAIKFPATSLAPYAGQNITKLGCFTDVDGDYGWTYSGNYELSVYAGSNAPTTLLGGTGMQYIAGDLAWHDINLQAPVAINGTQDLWIVGHTLDIAYPMSGCDYVGEPNSDYLSLDGSTWEHAGDYGLAYTWMLRAYVEQGRGGIEAIESGMVGSTYAFNITDIANYDERVYFLHNLMNDGRFNVINGEADGMFVISANDDSMDLEEAVNDFIFNNANEFAMMDKVQAAQVANAYKSTLPFSFVNSLMMDIYVASRENNLCELADPFCTDNGMYEFPAGVNAGSGETGPDYDCLYTTPNPAWYYMKIADPGDMDIYMYSTPSVDIDFCCWGPFDDPISPCPNGLTANKVVSCSYSAAPTENCIIPASAQTGEYYILVITNYSNQQCNINFSKVSGSGTTDCGIMPAVDIIGFLITLDGEYLDIVGPTVRDYVHEGEFGDHVYCVRPIYPGEMNLPDHNYGWSMGCPVCTNMDCAAPSHLEGTYEWRDGQFGALISWVIDSRDIVSYNIFRSNDGIAYAKIGSIDGNHTEYFDPVEVGTYYYQVTAVSDCGESVPALTENGNNFVIVTVTGIDENNGVAMYPNPTNGNVKIVANAMNHITVVNSLGQVVYDKDIDSDEMTINMAQFNVGVYTVRIATESGVSVQRLTVVR